MDLLFYYPSVHEATARTCALVCLTDLYPAQLAFRVIDALSARPCQHDRSVIVSFLTTVLLGQVSQAQLSVDRRRHAALVEAVGRAVCSIASPGGWLSGFSLWCNGYIPHVYSLLVAFVELPQTISTPLGFRCRACFVTYLHCCLSIWVDICPCFQPI